MTLADTFFLCLFVRRRRRRVASLTPRWHNLAVGADRLGEEVMQKILSAAVLAAVLSFTAVAQA
jgi:hypothetical protein